MEITALCIALNFYFSHPVDKKKLFILATQFYGNKLLPSIETTGFYAVRVTSYPLISCRCNIRVKWDSGRVLVCFESLTSVEGPGNLLPKYDALCYGNITRQHARKKELQIFARVAVARAEAASQFRTILEAEFCAHNAKTQTHMRRKQYFPTYGTCLFRRVKQPASACSRMINHDVSERAGNSSTGGLMFEL